ncbi:MAG: hypothetical protein Q7R35_12100 [Elusimicrobiota bacterium]|nr:hypothetical protein [Elusimicrobiota bacterium]
MTLIEMLVAAVMASLGNMVGWLLYNHVPLLRSKVTVVVCVLLFGLTYPLISRRIYTALNKGNTEKSKGTGPARL